MNAINMTTEQILRDHLANGFTPVVRHRLNRPIRKGSNHLRTLRIELRRMGASKRAAGYLMDMVDHLVKGAHPMEFAINDVSLRVVVEGKHWRKGW